MLMLLSNSRLVPHWRIRAARGLLMPTKQQPTVAGIRPGAAFTARCFLANDQRLHQGGSTPSEDESQRPSSPALHADTNALQGQES